MLMPSLNCLYFLHFPKMIIVFLHQLILVLSL
ncbi:unnamed protein product [Schistosoma curassoni]|uniref:Uncharacterized protein n=1 Tax=Schistosoma curassoni TaxID=6186 RepID=A0A183JF42_9TREM|nr:unnamed protein product [Schistosoma curassoni]